MTNKLEAKDYWEWRTSIEELEKYRLKAETAYLKFVIATTNLRAVKAEAELAKIAMSAERKESDFVAKEYQKFCEELEVRVGFKIRDRVIDPETFEVRDLGEKES